MRKALLGAAAVALLGCIYPWWKGEALTAERQRLRRAKALSVSATVPERVAASADEARPKSRVFRRDTAFRWGKKSVEVEMRGRRDFALVRASFGGDSLFEVRFDRWPGEAEWGGDDEAVRATLKAFSRKCGFFLFTFLRGGREYYALLDFAGNLLAFDSAGDCAEGPHFSPGARFLTTCKGLLDLENFSERQFDERRPVASVFWMGDSLYRVQYDDPSRDLRTNAYWYSRDGRELFAYYFNGLDYNGRYLPFVSTQNGIHLAFDPEAEELLAFRAADVADPRIYSFRKLKRPKRYEHKHVIVVPGHGEYEFFTDKEGRVVGAAASEQALPN
jgi:hypothetical protein